MGAGFLARLGAKLPAGNSEWAQLANFFPEGGAGTPKDEPKGEKGRHFDVASILSALQGLGGGNAPPQIPPPDWMPMPRPSAMMADVRNAPRLAQRPLMPAPDWMQPYLWGVR
jgi:hypothetical protein